MQKEINDLKTELEQLKADRGGVRELAAIDFDPGDGTNRPNLNKDKDAEEASPQLEKKRG
jgi:hypothetical protein